LSAFLVGREVGAKRMAPRGRGTLLFTGATASVRGASGFSAFSGAMHAKRALAQSLARELGPLGVHVAHVVVDGAIDTPWIRSNFPDRAAAAHEVSERRTTCARANSVERTLKMLLGMGYIGDFKTTTSALKLPKPPPSAGGGNLKHFVRVAQVGGLLRPESMAENYLHLHKQPRDAWTHELDLRPHCEKW